MGVLTVGDLPEEVMDRLRERAVRAGRSLEAEVLSILTQASLEDCQGQSETSIQSWVSGLYGGSLPMGVVDDLIETRRRQATSD